MGEHDEVYGRERVARLEALLREVAQLIVELDRRGELLQHVSELQQRLGDARSELFHYEVRATYDTPEAAESRRIVEDALRPPELTDSDPEDDEPWRPHRPE